MQKNNSNDINREIPKRRHSTDILPTLDTTGDVIQTQGDIDMSEAALQVT